MVVNVDMCIQQVRNSSVSTQKCIHLLLCTRLQQVWGDNPDTWNPDRFLNIDPTKQVRVGVFANL